VGMETNSTTKDVAVIGLGPMGQAVARTLLAGDRRVHVWNRTSARSDEVVADGATTGSLEEVVGAGPLVVGVLTDATTTRAVLEPVAGQLAGRTLVSLATGTPDEASAFAAWVEEQGGRYLDGSIMGPPEAIGTEDGRILVAGDPEAWAEHGATINELGAQVQHLGSDPQLAALLHITQLGFWYDTAVAYLDALATVRAHGVPGSVLAPVAVSVFEPTLGFLTQAAEETDAAEYPPGVATLPVHLEAIEQIATVRAEAGVDVAGIERIRDLVAKRIAAGHEAEGITGLVEDLVAR
jgi:3-hydroxyisobutyrate dehydrogenase-like beta-hydroxyacid dehydrogenase